MPVMAPSGVRISCDMLARKALLAAFAASALRRPVMSRILHCITRTPSQS